MRLHAFLLVRDEADILGQTLPHLLACFDSVHVLDTGSTDGTWDVVREFAVREKGIAFHAQASISGAVGARAYMFELARARCLLAPGDWIARVDADEFYHVPPREFLASFLEPYESRVFAQHYDFVLLHSLLASWEQHERQLGHAPPSPSDIQTARTHYLRDTSMWFEARLFRFRPGMRWHHEHPNPFNPGLAARLRIPIRHYRWRSLSQLRVRLALRAAQSRLDSHGDHWKLSQPDAWATPDDDPRLRTWFPGCPPEMDLPSPRDDPDLRHLEWPAKRRKQVLLYRSGLARMLDIFRTGSEPRSLRPNLIAGDSLA